MPDRFPEPDLDPKWSDDDPPLSRVTLVLCAACIEGDGGECHTPGCALWMSAAPDLPVIDKIEKRTDIHDASPPAVCLTVEQAEQIREALDVLARDTLDAPLTDVLARTDDGEVTAAFRTLAALLGAVQPADGEEET